MFSYRAPTEEPSYAGYHLAYEVKKLMYANFFSLSIYIVYFISFFVTIFCCCSPPPPPPPSPKFILFGYAQLISFRVAIPPRSLWVKKDLLALTLMTCIFSSFRTFWFILVLPLLLVFEHQVLFIRSFISSYHALMTRSFKSWTLVNNLFILSFSPSRSHKIN